MHIAVCPGTSGKREMGCGTITPPPTKVYKFLCGGGGCWLQRTLAAITKYTHAAITKYTHAAIKKYTHAAIKKYTYVDRLVIIDNTDIRID